MTSRVSFPRLLLETIKRHIAAVLITVLVFSIHIISFFLNLQNTISMQVISDSLYETSASDLEYIIKDITEMCAPNQSNAIVAMLIGAYLAFDFFRYMHSKKETDFYDSMPIRRQEWFKALFISCFGLFFVICSITLGIELALVFSTGFGSLTIFQNMLWSLFCMLGVFLASFVTTTLAMVMTGHSIVAFLGVGVFASYVPLILNNLIPRYSAKFFETYVYTDPSNTAYYFSPVTLGYKLMHNWDTWTIDEHWTYFVGVWIFTLIVGVIAYLLFLRRPSEAAGRAMAFEKANSVIRFLLVIPLALYAGLFLDEMSSFASTAWLIFGIIFASFILHGIIECIFQFDIRALVSKKRQLVISMVFSLGFMFIFLADLFNYDGYLPDADKTSYIEISTNMMGYSKSENWGVERDGIHGELIEDALTVASDIMNADNSLGDYYTEEIIFTYHLKNGSVKNRRYYYNVKNMPESLNSLATTDEFKDDYCILYNIERDRITSVRCENGLENQLLNLSESELNELCNIYTEELTQMKYLDFFTKPASLEMIFEYTRPNTKYNGTDYYYVYPNFTKTLAFLKEHGIYTFHESENVKLVNLEINGGKYGDDNVQYISDSKQLNELKEHMILGEFRFYDYEDEYLYCQLRVEINHQTKYLSVYLKQSDIDAVLKK